MQYIHDLQTKLPSNAKFIGVVRIDDVAYTVDSVGLIGCSIKSDSLEYKEYTNTLPRNRDSVYQYTDISYIQVQDTFDVFVVGYDDRIEEYWFLKNRVTTLEPYIRLDRELERCPSCREPLFVEESGVYCVNSICPAKVHTTIKKFLSHIPISESPFGQDFRIVTVLINTGILYKPSQLYEIDVRDLISLGLPSNVAEDFVERVAATKGKVKISTYLRSINLDYVSCYYHATDNKAEPIWIDYDRIDDGFEDIDCFIDWWNYVHGSRSISPEPYMSDSAFTALSSFFECSSNSYVVEELKALDVFTKKY